VVAVNSKIKRETAAVQIVLLELTKRRRAKRFVFLAVLVNTTTKRTKKVAKHVMPEGTRLKEEEIFVMIARRDARQDNGVPRDVNCAAPESVKI
jgi:hypothetical protein